MLPFFLGTDRKFSVCSKYINFSYLSNEWLQIIYSEDRQPQISIGYFLHMMGGSVNLYTGPHSLYILFGEVTNMTCTGMHYKVKSSGFGRGVVLQDQI